MTPQMDAATGDSRATWSPVEILELITLQPTGPGRWRARNDDSNLNGRAYGGQLLGQAMAAAVAGMPPGRAATMMQFLFMQGALPGEPLELEVRSLQDGKRFASRQVRGWQANGRTVLDAQVTCASALPAPRHSHTDGLSASGVAAALANEQPESLPRLQDVDEAITCGIERLGGYSRASKPSIDFRIPHAQAQIRDEARSGVFRYWMRAAQPLPDDPHVHAAAFAYLSDWWLNFSALGQHQAQLGQRRLYISSLNHAIWYHQPFRADQWLHMRSVSPVGQDGRGLSIGTVHDQAGRHVATVTQECLMAYAD